MLALQIYFLTAGAGHDIVIEYEVEVIRFSPVRPERRLQVNNRKARYICVWTGGYFMYPPFFGEILGGAIPLARKISSTKKFVIRK